MSTFTQYRDSANIFNYPGNGAFAQHTAITQSGAIYSKKAPCIGCFLEYLLLGALHTAGN